MRITSAFYGRYTYGHLIKNRLIVIYRQNEKGMDVARL
jgi:hypothetical protein